MNLFLLRHGIAEELQARKGFKDADRALTAEGSEKIKRIARTLERLELSFNLIWSSPYRRARETAAIVAERLGTPVELVDALVPGGSTRTLVDLLLRLPPVDNVLLVGHEPDLSELISLLTFGEKTSSVVMKKGGLCKLSAHRLCHGRCALLEWLLTPKQLILMT